MTLSWLPTFALLAECPAGGRCPVRPCLPGRAGLAEGEGEPRGEAGDGAGPLQGEAARRGLLQGPHGGRQPPASRRCRWTGPQKHVQSGLSSEDWGWEPETATVDVARTSACLGSSEGLPCASPVAGVGRDTVSRQGHWSIRGFPSATSGHNDDLLFLCPPLPGLGTLWLLCGDAVSSPVRQECLCCSAHKEEGRRPRAPSVGSCAESLSLT